LLETRVLHIDFPAAYREIEREERGERREREKKEKKTSGRRKDAIDLRLCRAFFFLAHVTRAISYIHN